MLAITQLFHFSDLAIITAQTYCKQSHQRPLFNTFSRYVMCYIGLSLICSKIYLLFLPELPKIFTYYSYFIPKHHQLFLFLFYCVNDVITMQE